MHGYVHVSACALGDQRQWGPPGAGVPGGCKPSSMGAGNKTVVLCRNSTQYSSLQPHFSGFVCFFETGSQPIRSYTAGVDLKLLFFMLSPPKHWEYRVFHQTQVQLLKQISQLIYILQVLYPSLMGLIFAFKLWRCFANRFLVRVPITNFITRLMCTLYITFTFISE